MTDIATALLQAAETRSLRVRSIVLLDWHDGPVEGIAEIEEPVSYWYFRLVADRRSSIELDDRVYLFAKLSPSATEGIRQLGSSFREKPLVWPFDQEANKEEVEETVNAAVASADEPDLLIQSADFREVKGIWRLVGRGFQLL